MIFLTFVYRYGKSRTSQMKAMVILYTYAKFMYQIKRQKGCFDLDINIAIVLTILVKRIFSYIFKALKIDLSLYAAYIRLLFYKQYSANGITICSFIIIAKFIAVFN